MPLKTHSICENVEWIDVSDPTVEEMNKLAEKFKLNKHIVIDSLQPEHLPKFNVVDNTNFLITRLYAHKAESTIATIQDITNKIAIFFTSDFLITVHKFEVSFLQIIYKRYVEGGKCTSTEEVVAKILWNSLETFNDPAQRLGEQIDFYEHNLLLRNSNNTDIQALYNIKQRAAVCNKVLLLMYEPINHLQTQRKDDPVIQDIRDQHLKMQTLFSQVLEDVNNLMNLYISYSAQRTSDVMKVLTMFSAFFLPLTFLVGIYGMNFRFMPELSSKWGYPVVILVMIIITVVIYFWFKKKKWL